MSMRRFGVNCDRCPAKSEEYGWLGSCRECWLDLCDNCMQDIREKEQLNEYDHVIGMTHKGICAACVLEWMEG